MASTPGRHQEHGDGLAERLTVAPELLSEDDHRQRRHDRYVITPTAISTIIRPQQHPAHVAP